MLSPFAILAASQQLWCVWQSHVLLQVAFWCGRSRKLQKPEVGTPRRQRHSRSLVLFASISTTNLLDRDRQQHDTPTSVTSFVVTSEPLFVYERDSTLNTPVGDRLQAS
ncbi:hypothetical protein ISCGN_030817 [Ixodes scapularis]